MGNNEVIERLLKEVQRLEEQLTKKREQRSNNTSAQLVKEVIDTGTVVLGSVVVYVVIGTVSDKVTDSPLGRGIARVVLGSGSLLAGSFVSARTEGAVKKVGQSMTGGGLLSVISGVYKIATSFKR